MARLAVVLHGEGVGMEWMSGLFRQNKKDINQTCAPCEHVVGEHVEYSHCGPSQYQGPHFGGLEEVLWFGHGDRGEGDSQTRALIHCERFMEDSSSTTSHWSNATLIYVVKGRDLPGCRVRGDTKVQSEHVPQKVMN